jgi:uncharacterized protein (TIGR02246 family)
MRNSIVDDAFGHHLWATERMLEACAALTDDQLATTVPGTYGSILDTLRHLVGGDTGYLHLLTNGQVAELEDEAHATVADLRAALPAIREGYASVLAGDPDLDADIARHRDDGSTSYAPLSIRLAQAVQHGTDHRSQISTALTTLGIEPPDLDMWAYADSRHRLAKVPASETLRAFAESYTAAWCSGDPARVAGHFAPNGSLAINGGAPSVGRDEITETARSFYTALPDMQVYLRDVVSDGPRVEYHWTFTGTNSGPGGTGNEVRVDGFEAWTLDDDGRIARSIGTYDADEYARQLREGV